MILGEYAPLPLIFRYCQRQRQRGREDVQDRQVELGREDVQHRQDELGREDQQDSGNSDRLPLSIMNSQCQTKGEEIKRIQIEKNKDNKKNTSQILSKNKNS